MPDYSYHNTPELIEKVIDKLGGIGEMLTFCQENPVSIERTEDWQFGCRIGNEKSFGGYYGIELDAFSALVLGIARYKHGKGFTL